MEEKPFLGLRLATSPGLVMTPRPATERLVLRALELVGDRRARVADVGTGSGAIAVALAAAAPRLEVWATDSSRAAVELARRNVHRCGLADRVQVVQGDLLEPVAGSLDLVVANLPYVPLTSSARHPDLFGEPAAAVYSDGDGLDPYRRLLSACETRLSADGALAIQLHRQILSCTRETLDRLRDELARPTEAAAA